MKSARHIIEGSEEWLGGEVSEVDYPGMFIEHDPEFVAEMIAARDADFSKGKGLEVDFVPCKPRLLGQEEEALELKDVVFPENVRKAANVIFVKVQDLISLAEKIGSWDGRRLPQNFVGTMIAPIREGMMRIARNCGVADNDICHIPTVLNSYIDPSGPGKAIIRELFPGCYI